MTRVGFPLPAEDDSLTAFAADLRALRTQAGPLSFRELSRRAYYSVGALSEAANGRKLPSLAVTLAYVRACGADEVEWERRWRELATAIPTQGTAGLVPYLGLANFDSADADRYFGRDQLVDQVCAAAADQRLVMLLGPSGSGKSSLLRAGLLHRARTRGIRGGQPVQSLLMTPGAHPLEDCAAQLAALTGQPCVSIHAALRSDALALHLLVLQLLATQQRDQELLLVVDQFEEIFTLCQDPAERQQFLTLLVSAAEAANSRIRIVLGIRADFYARCVQEPQLVSALRQAHVPVGPMSTEELREAITQPAALGGYRVDAALVTEIIADAVGQSGVLPLVSHALLETWQRRRGAVLTLASYREAGGIAHAIARSAETVFTSLTTEQQQWAKQLFLRLVSLSENAEDTRRRLPVTELDLDTPEISLVIERLTQARLITLDEHGVQITHEALIRHWPRLREWLDSDRDGLRVHRQLTEAAGVWRDHQDDAGTLYRGHRLSRAEEWAARTEPALAPAEREFLTASLLARSSEQAATLRRARRLQRLVALLAVLLLVAGGATAYATRAHQNATQQRTMALAQNVLAEAAILHTNNPELAAQLRLAAYRLTGSAEARNAVLSTLSAPPVVKLAGHTQLTTSVAYHPGGTLLASVSEDTTVRLWQLAGQTPAELAVLTGHTGYIHQVAFSGDGRLLATASWDHTVRLWDISDPARARALAVLTGHTDKVDAVAFLPGTTILASGGFDQTLRLWDLADPSAPRETARLGSRTGKIHSITTPRAGPILASVSEDGTVTIWDTTSAQQPRQRAEFQVDDEIATVAAFTPDGQVLATAGTDKRIHMWAMADPDHPRELTSIPGHTEAIHHLAISPDGRTMAGAGYDNTIRLWDLTDPRQPQVMAVIPAPTNVLTAVFSPDGQTMAATSEDHTVRLHSLSYYALTRHREQIASTTFDPQQSLLATTSYDGTIRLWDSQPRELSIVDRTPKRVTSVAFSPTQPILATSTDQGTRLWDIADPQRPTALATLDGPYRDSDAVTFSSDGHTLVTANGASIQLWDVTSPRQPRPTATISGSRSGVLWTAFSSDSRTLLTVDNGGTVRFWDLTNPQQPPREPTTLRDPAGPSYLAAFHPGRGILVTTSTDGAARVWDVTDPQHPKPGAVLAGHRVPITAAAFSPDGQILATTSSDDTVRLWQLPSTTTATEDATLTDHNHNYLASAITFSRDGLLAITTAGRTFRRQPIALDTAIDQICRSYRAITPTEWNRYFPDLPYESHCP